MKSVETGNKSVAVRGQGESGGLMANEPDGVFWMEEILANWIVVMITT